MIRKFLYIMVILFAMSNIAFGADVESTTDDSLYAKDMLKNKKPYVYSAVDLTCREIVAKNR